MPKILYIIRHAKSSWVFDLPDHDRPLNLRGRNDVRRIGKYLSDHEHTPDLIISSTASRALYTALHIGDEWGYPEDQISMAPELYHASVEQSLELLASLDEEVDSVAIFGHNPGFTELVNHFQTTYLDNLPTCGVVAFNLEIEKWTEIHLTKGEQKLMIIPKRLPS